MPRYIDADALIDDIRKHSESYFADDFAHEWVDKQPSVDVQLVRHGHWILDKAFVNIETYYYRCSECGNERCFTEDYKADWCEECGARMDGEQNG